MPDFNFNAGSFPMAAVIQAAQQNNALQQQAREDGQNKLIEGLKSISQVGSSLLDRKMKMAQALAGAKMYAQTPEGQQMLAPTKTTTTTPGAPVMRNQTAAPATMFGQSPVMQNQTAAYNSLTGALTPNTGNAGLSGVGTMAPPKTTTTTTPSPVGMKDIQTAMIGESPSNMLTQLFNRQKERQEFGLKQQEQGFKEKMKPIELAQQAALTNALTGVKGREVSVQEQNNLRTSIANEESRKQQAIKDFPGLTGSILSGILPEGTNEKEKAARNAYASATSNIENYHRQLYGGGSTGGGTAGGKVKLGVTMTTPGGLTYTVNQ